MKFKISYVVLTISVLFYANTQIMGPITPRHIMLIYMAYLCYKESSLKWTDKYMNCFLVFIFLFGFSSLITGYIDSFTSQMISNIMSAVVVYWATKILNYKYHSINIFIYTIIAIGILNALVSIGQFMYIPMFMKLPELLHVHTDEYFLELVAAGRDLLGKSVPGLVVNDVYNGYFMSVVTIFTLYFQKKGFKPLFLIPWLISMIASFCIQERSPFYLALIFSFYLFFQVLKRSNSSFKFVYILFFVAISLYSTNYLFDILLSGESRFALGMDDTNRGAIYNNVWDFISQNVLFGGWYYSKELNVAPPHNLILNAWVYAGVFGVLVIIYLVVSQLLIIFKNYRGHVQNLSFENIVIGLAFTSFTLNSLLHNVSVLTGDSLVWMLWGGYTLINYSNVKIKKGN